MKKVLVCCLLSGLLVGCGQSGPLYLGPSYADTSTEAPVDMSDIPEPT